MDSMNDRGFEIMDSFCTVDGKAVKNTGSSALETSGMEILDSESGTKLAAGEDFTWDDPTIAAGEVGGVRVDCGENNVCRYRIVYGRTSTAIVQC